MRCYYHIERDFATIPMNFLWFEYHQIRFISFGIWFLGLFLTDFTTIISTPGDDGWKDVLLNIKVISIIHLIFLSLFLIYLIFRILTDKDSNKVNAKMIIQSMFDMSIHLDIAAIIFSCFFLKNKKNSMFIVEILIIIDAVLTIVLTPFKTWRAFIDIFGALPTVVLGHVSLYKTINYLFVFTPISVILLSPLIFTIIAIGAMKHITVPLKKFIKFFDPSLLPNSMKIDFNNGQNNDNQDITAPMLIPNNSSETQLTFLNNIMHNNNDTKESRNHFASENLFASENIRNRDKTRDSQKDKNDGISDIKGGEHPPSIQEKATTGSVDDYFDFKSIPAAVFATFFIHFSVLCQGEHSNTMVVMAHYFITLAMILINSRVVALPAIILTNVSDSSVQFNSVWPELGFV